MNIYKFIWELGLILRMPRVYLYWEREKGDRIRYPVRKSPPSKKIIIPDETLAWHSMLTYTWYMYVTWSTARTCAWKGKVWSSLDAGEALLAGFWCRFLHHWKGGLLQLNGHLLINAYLILVHPSLVNTNLIHTANASTTLATCGSYM